MTNSNNGGDHGSYEGDFSLPAVYGPIIPPINPTSRDVNVPNPDSWTSAPWYLVVLGEGDGGTSPA
ncbi:UNVERIFIED_CONTAM: hypothetical protein Sindi_1810500, partial [Sesamum indicum]